MGVAGHLPGVAGHLPVFFPHRILNIAKRERGGIGVGETYGLAELLGHRLVAHYCLVVGGEGLAIRVQPAANAGVPSDYLAVLIAEKGIVHIGLEVAEHRSEANHLLRRTLDLRPLREKVLRRRRGVDRRPPPDTTTLSGKRLAAQAFLRVILGALDFAQDERNAFQHTPEY